METRMTRAAVGIAAALLLATASAQAEEPSSAAPSASAPAQAPAPAPIYNPLAPRPASAAPASPAASPPPVATPPASAPAPSAPPSESPVPASPPSSATEAAPAPSAPAITPSLGGPGDAAGPAPGADTKVHRPGANDPLIFAASFFIPQSGVRWERGDSNTLNVSLSWPLSVPLAFGTRAADELPIHRVVIEPGFTFVERTTGFARGGYRAVWHPTGSFVGVGAGIGSTFEIFAPGPARPSLSPEIVVHLGKTGSPGFLMALARYDRFFAVDPRDTFTFALGIGFF